LTARSASPTLALAAPSETCATQPGKCSFSLPDQFGVIDDAAESICAGVLAINSIGGWVWLRIC
jgi:hypothetical protein